MPGLIDRLRAWKARRLRTKRCRRLWRRVREHCAAIRVVHHELSPEWRSIFNSFHMRMKAVEAELYNRVLAEDQILRHVPKDHPIEPVVLQIKIGFHRSMGNNQLAYVYQQSLQNLQLQMDRRTQMLANAQRIENEVLDFTFQLQRWGDQVMSVSRVGLSGGSDNRVADVMEQMQQEMEGIHSAIRDAQAEVGY
ncbi:MAG: hypothetical protein ACYC1M_13390 [Armatimonadota bacterium]